MDWKQLKNNHCPQCKKELHPYDIDGVTIIECGCGFKISEKRMGEIIRDMVNRNIKGNRIQIGEDEFI